jgi:hypothetical protein
MPVLEGADSEVKGAATSCTKDCNGLFGLDNARHDYVSIEIVKWV